MTSDVIKRIIAQARPICTFVVWSPIRVASRTTSRHHQNESIRRRIKFKNRSKGDVLKVNSITIDIMVAVANNGHKRGHGLICTKWKGIRGGREIINTFDFLS